MIYVDDLADYLLELAAHPKPGEPLEPDDSKADGYNCRS